MLRLRIILLWIFGLVGAGFILLLPSTAQAADGQVSGSMTVGTVDGEVVQSGRTAATEITQDILATSGNIVTVTASSSNGPIESGRVSFYTSCDSNSWDVPSVDFYEGEDPPQVTLPDGDYRIEIYPNSGYGAITSWHEAKGSCANAAPVTISEDTTINAVAKTGTDVTGSVTDTNGNPVANGNLTFYKSCTGGSSDYAGFRNSQYAATVRPGNYLVQIRPYDYYDPAQEPTSALDSWHAGVKNCENAEVVTVGSDPLQLDLIAEAGSVVSGSVSSSNGPVESGSIEFYKSCKQWNNHNGVAYTSINGGSYSTAMRDGTYLARITPSGGTGATASWHNAISACADATTFTVSGDTATNLVALPGSNITGTVSSRKGPIQDYGEVRFFSSCQAWQNDNPSSRATIYNGQYTASLADGDYKVYIYTWNDPNAVNSWHSAKRSCADADTITVSGDATMNLTASASAILSGEVNSSRGPIVSGSLEIYAGCEPSSDGWIDDASISGGTYSVSVPDGTYYIEIRPTDNSGALRSWHSAQPDCDQAEAITVNDDTNANLLAQSGAIVSGTVTDTSDNTVQSGRVKIYQDCTTLVKTTPINSGSYQTVVSDGTYQIKIKPSADETAAPSWHTATPSCADAEPITITGDLTQDITARSPVSVTGFVTNENNVPAEGTVWFYASCDYAAEGYHSAFAPIINGEYSLEVLPGSYLAKINPPEDSNSPHSWHSQKNTCRDADPITITGNETQDLIAVTPVKVTGFVTNENNVPAEGTVWYYASCGYAAEGYHSAFAPIINGEYSLEVLPGDYLAKIVPPEDSNSPHSWHSQKNTCRDADPITITGNETQDLIAVTAVPVSGSVTNEIGDPVTGTVRFHASCDYAAEGYYSGLAPVTNGRYSLMILPGTYFVQIRPGKGVDSAPSWHAAKPSCAEATAIIVTGNSDVDLRASGDKPSLSETSSPSPSPTSSAEATSQPPATQGPPATQAPPATSTPPPPADDPVTAPGAVKKLSIKKLTSAKMKAVWKKPASDGGAKIKKYQTRIKVGKKWKSWKADKPKALATSKSNQYAWTWKKLKSGKKYQVQVRAKNSAGVGPKKTLKFKTKK
jgi:protocatechuate 3,4-dioxygenase beta subunit